MKPWIIFTPIRELILLIFAIICVWIPFVLFNLDVSSRNIRNFIPILAAVGALFATGTQYIEYDVILICNNYKIPSANFIAITLFFWMVVKDAMDEMKESKTNKKMEMELIYLDEYEPVNHALSKMPRIQPRI